MEKPIRVYADASAYGGVFDEEFDATSRGSFDCVEMKRQGAERIHEATKDMTFEQKVAYWRDRSRQFRDEQKQLAIRNPRS